VKLQTIVRITAVLPVTLNEPVFLARSCLGKKFCLSVYGKESETRCAVTTKNKGIFLIVIFVFEFSR